MVAAINLTDEPVLCGPGYILKMGGYAVIQPIQEHMQGMMVESYISILGVGLLGCG